MTNLYHLPSKSHVPVGIEFFVGMYLNAAFDRLKIKRQQVLTWTCKKLHFIARRQNYSLRDHFQIKRHIDPGFVCECTNFEVFIWRHNECQLLIGRSLSRGHDLDRYFSN